MIEASFVVVCKRRVDWGRAFPVVCDGQHVLVPRARAYVGRSG